MKNLPFFLLLLLVSCSGMKSSINKKEYRRSEVIATYSGMRDELQDGYLVLKKNGYFRYYDKLWVIVSVKENECIGRYSRKGDTVFLDWLNVDPKKLGYYLSNKCIIKDSAISFVEEDSNKPLWELSFTRGK